MQKFIDIHTHHQRGTKGISVFNIEENFGQCVNFNPCSIGIHPWFVTYDSFEVQLKELIRNSTSDTVFAIGECGLDKLCKTEWFLQEQVFMSQIKLANQIDKPLLIHCVKAFNEVVQCLKKSKNHVPVIFHGFNKNTNITKSLVKEGYYLSFGDSILKDQHLESLKACPLSQLFLETDNADLEIERVYGKVSEVLDISIDLLTVQLHLNYDHIRKNNNR